MSLFLINLQSNQQIPLDKENPLIIGRNNVLGCFDKKVSRSHGKITCTENGKVNLVALHTNPCFFMKKGEPPIRQLNKDEEETLNEGDCLGLLPNLFWFKVSSKTVSIKEEPEANSESCRDSETVNLANIKDSKGNTSETQNVKLHTTGSSDYSKRIGSPEFEKTRRLPLSAYETDVIKVADKYSNSRDNDVKIKELKLSDEDCDIEVLEAKNENSNKENNKDREEPSTSKICADETLANYNKMKERSIPENNESKLDKSIKRSICQYEFDCFRQNPQHKTDFSHPGDPDYVAYENRPFCQYGRACCRTNKRHKVEFRHEPAKSPISPLESSPSRPPSSIGEERPPCFGGSRCLNHSLQHRKDLYHPPKASPLPTKRRRKEVKRNFQYEDEDEDEYDLEEPFINDASSDEYVPSDLNSEEDLDESQETH